MLALTEKLAAAESVVGDLAAIATKSLSNMQVALGGSALDMSTQSPLTILAEHKRVSAVFTSKFKAGGLAAVDAAAATAEKPSAFAHTNVTQAQLNAIGGY